MGRLERYVQRAIESASSNVQSAEHGDRNASLFREACSLGELVGAGVLPESSALEVLLEAAEALGLPRREASSSIRSGIKRGLQNPRDLPREAETVRAFKLEKPPTKAPPREGANPPPRGPLESVLMMTVRTGEDGEVASYLRSRGLDPSRIDRLGLARALPRTASALPSWCSYWPRTGHRLLLPLFAPGSRKAVSFKARRVVDGDGPKSVSPTGFPVSGLLFADANGRALLGGQRPASGQAPQVVVTEGGMDFLVWGSVEAAQGAPRAVLGVFGGSWTEAAAQAIPDGSQVIIRTHHDAPGNKYAQQIQTSLHNRCEVLRSKP